MTLLEINNLLERLPALKESAEREAGIARLEEKKVRAIRFLEEKAKNGKATIPELEAIVDSDDSVYKASLRAIEKEAVFRRERDALDATLEIARNERSLMKLESAV
jgi:hypothetical protein